MPASRAIVQTTRASRYLQQLCKHFGHKIPVEFTPEAGWIRFDFGRADLAATANTLTMTATAGTAEDLARLQRVLASHLERFAFRDALRVRWGT